MKNLTLIITLILFCSSFIFAQKQNHKVEANEVGDTIETAIDSGCLTLRVYPNPFNTLITIECTNEYKTISVYDICGRIVFECKNENNTITIDLSEQKCGTYFLRLDNETIKIIKQ